MTAMGMLLLIAVVLVGLGALIYHYAHKTTLGSTIQTQVGSAVAAKVAEIATSIEKKV